MFSDATGKCATSYIDEAVAGLDKEVHNLR